MYRIASVFIFAFFTCPVGAAAEDYLAALEELGRAVESLDADEPNAEQQLLLRDVTAELARPRFASPESLRWIAKRLKTAGNENDPAVVRLCSLIEDAAKRIDGDGIIPATEPVDLATERKSLAKRLAEFEAYLRAKNSDGFTAWKDFLCWEDTKSLTTAGQPAAALLDRLETRWANAPLAWNDASLATTAIAVVRFARLARRAASGRTPDDWAKQARELSDALQRPSNGEGDCPNFRVSENGTVPLEAAIVRLTVELERHGVAAELCNAARRKFSHPTALLAISADSVKRRLATRIDEPFEVDDVFAGTPNVGEGRMTGKITLVPSPSPSVARWRLELEAASQSRSVGCNRGVRVVSRCAAEVVGRKLMEWNAALPIAFPAVAEASAEVQFESIAAGGLFLRRQLSEKRVHASRPLAEQDAARATARSIRARLDGATADMLSRAADAYDREIRTPLSLDLNAISTIVTRATDSEYVWTCRQEPRDGFSARRPPPGRIRADARLDLHESFVQDMLARRLRGKTMTGREVAAWLEQLFGVGSAPPSADDWQVRWVREAPVICKFSDGLLRFEFRTEGFSMPDGEFAGLIVRAAYRPSREGDVFHLVREGELGIYPRGFQPGKDRLTGRQMMLRKAAKRRLDSLFAAKITPADIPVSIAEGQTIQLHLADISCADGWFSAGIDVRQAPASGVLPRN